MLVQRRKILSKIVAETIHVDFANYVASTCLNRGWDAATDVISGCSYDDGAFCYPYAIFMVAYVGARVCMHAPYLSTS